MAGFANGNGNDPSLDELNKRLFEIKKSSFYEESRKTSPEQLTQRLKQLKNLISSDGIDLDSLTDEQLYQRYQEIFRNDEHQNQNTIMIDNQEKEKEVDITPYLQENNLDMMTGTTATDDHLYDDDFELFLADAGISDKIIQKIQRCDQNQVIDSSNDSNIEKLEATLASSDHLIDSFHDIGDSNDVELSQLMNQAHDELRLLPSSTTSYYPQSSEISIDLQDEFDGDINDNDEIRRLVAEAQDLAALERKYNTSKPLQQNMKPTSLLPSNTRSTTASRTYFQPNDYYYRVQAHNITKDSERKKKKQFQANDDSDSQSNSSDSSDESC